MVLKFWRVREASRFLFLRRLFSGDCYEKCKPAISLWKVSSVTGLHGWDIVNSRTLTREFHFQRFSSSSKLPKKPPSNSVILSFIKSTLDQPEGPNHCWLNKFEGTKNLYKKNGTFLVLVGDFLESSSTNCGSYAVWFEKVKLIQQRFPQLCVMGLQPNGLTCSTDKRSSLIQLVLKENITFPILLSNKTFYEVSNEPCYILFKDFKNPALYLVKDLDFEVLNKAVEELHVQQNGNSRPSVAMFNAYTKQDAIIKEPNLCSLRNFLFYFPGCIAADRGEDRVFVSDSNHHRVIVLNRSGKILDCIGSSPGFEDGEFESAKLMRPTSLFYHPADDYLYLIDSENHAIRRADMERRVLETLTPACKTNKKSRLWTWFMDKLGWESHDKTESEEVNVKTLMFPWHLIKSPDGNLLVIDRRFETSWIITMDSGEIQEVVEGFSNILEICGQQIREKVSLLKQMPHDWLQQQAKAVWSPKELPYAGLISSLTNFQDELIACDMVGQTLLKLSGENEGASDFQFSNFGVLGLPYWLQPHLEIAYKEAVGPRGTKIDHVQHFNLLPGRVDIQLNVNVPAGTELMEPIQEGCIWRQARGVAAIVSESEDVTGSPEKVGSAQKWYDELDCLAFSAPESESPNEDDDTTTDKKFHDDRVQISTAVNTSPGTSEVIVSTVLYLRLRREPDQQESDQEIYASKILDLLNSSTSGNVERDSCIQFLLKSSRDLRDLIFMRPLHVRIKLDSFDHPKADNSRDIILTESSIEVNVSL